MTRPSKRTIEPLLEECARLEARRIGIEYQRDRDLEPLKEAYEKKAGLIVEEANRRLAAINRRCATLREQISGMLMAGVDEKAETVALAEVAIELETTKAIAGRVAALNKVDATSVRTNDDGKPILRAIASVDAKPGNREIDPQKFFESVKESERTGPFWSCIKVLISNAEKFLGQVKVDELAKKPKTYSVSFSLKP